MKLRTTLLIGALLLVGLGIGAAHAASPKGQGSGATSGGQAYPDPSGPVIQLAASSDDKTASLTVVFNLNSEQPDWHDGWSKYLSVTFQTPVGQGATFTNTATLDGLTKSTSIQFKLALWTGGFLDDLQANAYAYDPVFQGKCWAEVQAAGGTPNFGKPCDLTVMNKSISKLDDYNKERLGKEANDLWKDEVDRGTGDLWGVSVNGKIGYEDHDYFDPTTFVKTSANELPFQVGIEGTYVWGHLGQQAINISFNYQRTFKDSGSSETRCLSAAPPAITCATGFFGAPSLKTKELAGIDYRYIGKAFGMPFGVNPGFTYDGIDGSYAFQFPLYLFSDSNHHLTGGVRYDWTSTKHVSMVGVFASAAFGILD